jgi:hypothetical protein
MNIDQNGSQDFARLIDLQQQYNSRYNQLQELEVTINRSAQTAAEATAGAYVILQEETTRLEGEIKALFEKHPDWRGEKKSVSTPFGAVEQRTVTELVVENPALTVALIERRGEQDATFKTADLLHIEKTPNLEALERFDDATLVSLGVSRKKTERITVKPTKVSVAKTVKAAKRTKSETVKEAA